MATSEKLEITHRLVRLRTVADSLTSRAVAADKKKRQLEELTMRQVEPLTDIHEPLVRRGKLRILLAKVEVAVIATTVFFVSGCSGSGATDRPSYVNDPEHKDTPTTATPPTCQLYARPTVCWCDADNGEADLRSCPTELRCCYEGKDDGETVTCVCAPILEDAADCVLYGDTLNERLGDTVYSQVTSCHSSMVTPDES